MKATVPARGATADDWVRARAGDFKGATEIAGRLLRDCGARSDSRTWVELNLVCASCAIRQGDPQRALASLDAAEAAAKSPGTGTALVARVDARRAELAYVQGRYAMATELVARLLPGFERDGDLVYAAFVLRARLAVLLARGDYDAVGALAKRAISVARASGDAYMQVQIHNVLGATRFDRATSKLHEPHARTHLSALDPADAAPMEDDAHKALECFRQARTIAEAAGYDFAAWYVAGNIERLELLLGRPKRAIAMIRKRLKELQSRGARYDEIVTRSNLAGAMRVLGRHRDALHELDVALSLARSTGTANVMLEYLECDRSIALDALGDTPGARASYRRYLQLVGAYHRPPSVPDARPVPAKRALEPGFLKRADRYIRERLAERFSVAELARHCGVGVRTLEKAMIGYRSITPVAHIRNTRLDRTRIELVEGQNGVAEVARRCGFLSPTSFAPAFRQRFGVAPSRARAAAQGRR